MDPLVERQLGLEVGVLAVAVGEVLAVEDLDEGLDEARVELGAGDAGADSTTASYELTGSR